MIKLVIKGNIIFVFHKYFYEEISKKVSQVVIVLGGIFPYHSLAFPVRDKEKSFIHTSSYWSCEA
jgi:hypothetical protein